MYILYGDFLFLDWHMRDVAKADYDVISLVDVNGSQVIDQESDRARGKEIPHRKLDRDNYGNIYILSKLWTSSAIKVHKLVLITYFSSFNYLTLDDHFGTQFFIIRARTKIWTPKVVETISQAPGHIYITKFI